MPAAAIAPAAGIAGGIAGQLLSSGDQAAAGADMAAAQAAYANIAQPTIAEQQWQLAQEQAAGSLQPASEGTYTMGSNAMAGIQTNPQYAQAQQAALASLAQQGQGGLTAQERANLINSNQAIAGNVNAQNAAINQSMAARGMGGSGVQLAAQLANSQGGANQASTNANNINAQAQNTALQALSQQGGLATQMQGQQFGQQAAIAQAQNAINQFNTANTQNVAGTNTQYQNQAQAANLANAQNIANTNVGLTNQQQAHNTGLYQQQFQDQMAQAQGMAGADVANAGYQSGQAQQIAGMASGIGAGLGTMGAAFAGSGGSSGGGSSGGSGGTGNGSFDTQASLNNASNASANGQTIDLSSPQYNYGSDGGLVPRDLKRYNHGGEVSTLGMNSFAEGGYVGGTISDSPPVHHDYNTRNMAEGGAVDDDSDDDKPKTLQDYTKQAQDAQSKAAAPYQNKASQDAFMKSLAAYAAAQKPAMPIVRPDAAAQFGAGVASPLVGSAAIPAQPVLPYRQPQPGQGYAQGGRVRGYYDGDVVAPNPASMTAGPPNTAIPNQNMLAQGTMDSIPPTNTPYMGVGSVNKSGQYVPTNRQSNAAAVMGALTNTPTVAPSGIVSGVGYPMGNAEDAADAGVAATAQGAQDKAFAKVMQEAAAHKAAKKASMSDDDTQKLAFGGPVASRPLPPPQPLMNPRVPLVPNPQMGPMPVSIAPPRGVAGGAPMPQMTQQQKTAILAKMHHMADGGEVRRDGNNQGNTSYNTSESMSPMPIPMRQQQDMAIKNATAPKMSNGGEAQYDFKSGGHVPGKAKVMGDNPKNDTVKAKLSPGEIVIPRTIAQSGDNDKIMNFVQGVLSKKK